MGIDSLPYEVEYILNVLYEYGYEAYLVGGCVRDRLLGSVPSDYDITTNALPQEVVRIFSDKARVVETGIRHGTVTVIKNDVSVEITTYRVDGDYEDNRHPACVSYSSNLKDDVMRRDFTINAIAYSPKSGLKDYVNGEEDIKARIIRCVGDPEKRFEEDALRILRALRFASVLGFEIEEKTSSAIIKKAFLLNKISKERISSELTKLLCGIGAEQILVNYRDVFAVVIPEIKCMFDFDQHNQYHKYDVYTHSVKALALTPTFDSKLRVAAFLHDIGKPSSYFTDESGQGHFNGHAKISAAMADTILRDLRYPNAFREEVVELIRLHDAPVTNEDKRIKKLLRNLGEEAFFRFMALHRADNSAKADKVLYRLELYSEIEARAKEILEEKPCFSLSDMEINGNDLIEMGVPKGKKIGLILNCLLDDILENRIENNRQILLDKARQYMED